MKKQKELIDYFSQHISENRKELIEKLLTARTRRITVVLEDVYQSLNASAVLRSCDGFGVQDVHFVEQRNAGVEIKKNISMGTAKWLTIHKHTQQNGKTALHNLSTQLKQQGYSLVATSPHATDTLETLSLDSKVALLFGTEDEGLTQEAFALADKTVKIPMFGFAESFNVSVSVALCLYALTTRLRSNNKDWQLSLQEQEALRLEWYKNSVRNAEIYEREFLSKK